MKLDTAIAVFVGSFFFSTIGWQSWPIVVGGTVCTIAFFGLWVGNYLMPKRPDVAAQIKQLEASNNELVEKVGTLERDLLAFRIGQSNR